MPGFAMGCCSLCYQAELTWQPFVVEYEIL